MTIIALNLEITRVLALFCLMSILMLIAAFVVTLTIIASTCLSRRKGEYYPEIPEKKQ